MGNNAMTGVVITNWRAVSKNTLRGFARVVRCSERTARRLTKERRDRQRAERAGLIYAAHTQGKPVRQIAAEIGVSRATVGNVVQKTPMAETGHQAGPHRIVVSVRRTHGKAWAAPPALLQRFPDVLGDAR
jgi:hypothetical protein